MNDVATISEIEHGRAHGYDALVHLVCHYCGKLPGVGCVVGPGSKRSEIYRYCSFQCEKDERKAGLYTFTDERGVIYTFN